MGESGDTDEIHDRVHLHFGEVELEARRMARRLGPNARSWVSHEELVSWGGMGLLEAARRFEPDRGVPFAHFARPRVRGAMVDGLRESNETPQRLWRARSAAEGEPSSAAVLSHHAERLAGARSTGWLAEAGSGEDGDPVALAREPDPETAASGRQLAQVIAAALEALPLQEARLIRLHVLADEPLAEVAGSLGVSVPRASQLRARALRRLEPRLRGLSQPDADLPSAGIV